MKKYMLKKEQRLVPIRMDVYIVDKVFKTKRINKINR